MAFDPNDPFNHSSFNNHYDHHTSRFDRQDASFNRHDHFASHTQPPNEIKTGIDPFHYDSQRTRIDEEHSRAAREHTMQITRNLEIDAISITARLKKFFASLTQT